MASLLMLAALAAQHQHSASASNPPWREEIGDVTFNMWSRHH